ncbi:MAG: hydantoinase/oxoprolinase family protein [Anaerolineales bacterium]|nr:hydantoinase/oxoprolinase family protein [Anaerolineales bacterium]MBS3752607.1 hydantoinase/oxoprolinase family protein [Anaerolineales bacterium]
MNANNESQKKEPLVLGIDTGGTYTDGVLLEYNTHKILATHKSLTTKRDFAIGIENVIAEIDIEDPSAIQMVSVSTTLATNAIAEGKGKRVALFLIGYDPDLIDSFQLSDRFATPNFHYISGGHDLHGHEKEELDLSGLLSKVDEIKRRVDAIAISSYFSPRNPEHEIRAQKAVSSVCELPIVLGHQLSTKLGSVERATTAALNASLLAVLQEFIIAVRRAMEHRGIEAPLMVVRGDGTLMNDEFAARTPVETIHSGPAASAIGGRFLSQKQNALVIDVGGTTTDFALIQDGKVTISEKGATAAGYQTAVKAADLLSIGLGGDSYITTDRKNEIVIGPERVVPLAYLSHQYPNVKQRLQALTKRSWPAPSPAELEYWFLQREIEDESGFSNREMDLIHLLESGPKPVKKLLEKMDVLDQSQLNIQDLWREEILGKSGFTPTDILHIEGLHTPWDMEASQASLTVFCNYLSMEKEAFLKFIWDEIAKKIASAVVHFLTEKKIPGDEVENENLGKWFLTNSLFPHHPHLETSIQLRDSIVGIGAPAQVMIQQAADILNTELILPDHYAVANATGAVAGSVMVTEEVLIYPHLSGDKVDVIGYYVQSREERSEYEALESALENAKQQGEEKARSAALRSGADNPQVVVDVHQEGMDTYRITAKAVGKPRLEV